MACVVIFCMLASVLARVFRRWYFWLVYLFFVVFSFLLLWLSRFLTASEAFALLSVASLIGFLFPEIWQGTRNAVVNFFSRPRNILGAGLIVLVLFYPAILGTILVLIFTILALWHIFLSFLKK